MLFRFMVETHMPLFGYSLTVTKDAFDKSKFTLKHWPCIGDTKIKEKAYKDFSAYHFVSDTGKYSFYKKDGNMYFIHTKENNSLVIMNIETRQKTEIVLNGFSITDLYCPRYLEFKTDHGIDYFFDNCIGSDGKEDIIDFYQHANDSEEVSESKYTNYFFISGKETENSSENIYVIDISDFSNIVIRRQKVVKIPFIPLDKSVFFQTHEDSMKYMFVGMINHENTELCNQKFERVMNKIKVIENAKIRGVLLDFLKNVDSFVFEMNLPCFDINLIRYQSEIDNKKIDVYNVSYAVGNRKFMLAVGDCKEVSLWVTMDKKHMISGDVEDVDYDFVLNWLYKDLLKK